MKSLLWASLLLIAMPGRGFEFSTPLLLSGEVRARNSQQFLSPMTDNWRVELQWLMPEGQVAEAGEIVTVFDGAQLQGQLTSETVALTTAEEKLQQEKSKHAETLLANEYALKREQLLLKKARIDAAIPDKFLSKFEHESYQVAVTEAITSVHKAKEALVQARLAREVALEKQRILIERSKDKLAMLEQRLSDMSLKAERRGPVIYGKHPWTGERVFVGMTAQPSWVIAEIPSLQHLYIESWLHEIDVDRVVDAMQGTLIFDAYPNQPLGVTLTAVATQPEKRNGWGPGLFYRMEFTLTGETPFQLLPGMGARIEMEMRE
ncbi:HlyD family secretion protein [Microbulbifer pacificus]|uniref:HlyD family secretion protein n=1 Tax=Microbulbifer pacificus TaxID=407164 RepID=A0AAU0MZ20_9GAMM|nr:hypothetical protein [Microbulbifer pacificus]WOX05263.1 hypothetical protein R5R33_16180 [Microbulbifer pacificus]